MVVSAARRGRLGSQPAVFHGWWIVLVAFLCFAVNTGLIFYAWSIFLVPLATAFGGHARVAGAYSTMQAVSALAGLWVGRVVDRRGARPVEIAGTLLLVAGFLGMSQVRTLPQLYFCMAGPIALGSTCIAGLPNNAAVARWFVRKRGRALGISTAGISAGGIVFAPLAQFLTVRVGWRAAYALLGGLVAVLLLPPILLFMRRDPADLGLLPDGEEPGGGAGDAAARAALAREIERSVHPAAAMRQANFWLIAAAFALTMAGLSSVLLYQVPLLIDRGMPPERASLVLSATAAMGVVGKLGFGALLDRFDQRRVAAVCFCLQAAGVLLLWQARSLGALACYVVLYGYAMGGNATLLASLVGEAFGRLHYGTISGRLTPFVVVAQGLAVPATGWLRDRTGGYGPALALDAAAALLAAAVVLRMRLPPRRILHEPAPSHR
jgi:MFS family permease